MEEEYKDREREMVGIVFALEIRRRKEKMGDDEMGWIFSKEYTDRERKSSFPVTF